MTVIGMFNGWEILLILLLALILFGAKKLPELARGLGQGIREFRRSTREVTDELQAAVDMDDYSSPAPQRKIPQPNGEKAQPSPSASPSSSETVEQASNKSES